MMPGSADGHARVLRGWERFWFREIPPQSYAALRIAFGLVGMVMVTALTPVRQFWWLDGLSPLPAPGSRRILLVDVGLTALGGDLFFWGLLALFAAMVVGFKSRSVVTLCFVGIVFRAIWNRLPLSGAYQAFMVLLFCLVWAETGACWSVDSWLLRRRQAGRVDPEPESIPIWPLRLMRFQIALMYVTSGLWKLQDPAWRDGTAVYYALSHNVLQRFPFALPFTGDLMLTSFAYVTLAWELSFPLLLFSRLSRRVALLLGVLIHLGILATLEVGSFSLVMLSGYLAFLDPDLAPGRIASVRRRVGRSM